MVGSFVSSTMGLCVAPINLKSNEMVNMDINGWYERYLSERYCSLSEVLRVWCISSFNGII